MFSRIFSVKNIAFILGVVILLYIMPKITGIVLLFFAAYVLACALDPWVDKLQAKFKNNRMIASIVVVFGGFLAALAVFTPLLAIAINEIKTFIGVFPEKIMQLINYLSSLQIYGHKVSEFIKIDTIMDTTPDLAQNVFSQSLNITMGIFQFFVVSVAIGMIIFYLLADKKYLSEKFLELFPADLRDRAAFIQESIGNKVGGYVRAQALSMIAIGIMQMIVLMLMGVDYALLLGLITGVMDIVPVMGPVIALTVILLVAYPVGIVKLILLIVTFFLIQQASNIVVRPLLFGKFMKLHPLTIFLALFVAEQFLGFWGVILSPAIAATVCVLIDELYIKSINAKQEEAATENE